VRSQCSHNPHDREPQPVEHRDLLAHASQRAALLLDLALDPGDLHVVDRVLPREAVEPPLDLGKLADEHARALRRHGPVRPQRLDAPAHVPHHAREALHVLTQQPHGAAQGEQRAAHVPALVLGLGVARAAGLGLLERALVEVTHPARERRNLLLERVAGRGGREAVGRGGVGAGVVV
jgi:hypothetical protein